MKEYRRRGQKKLKTNRQNIVGLPRRSKEPIDYGVTKDQFYEVLDKAAQLVKNPKSDSEKVQT
ncbi:MAG: hypothetical protein WCA51_03015 [Dehalococcoidia bacterium]